MTGLLNAGILPNNVIKASSLAVENGGTKTAIDAYSDGAGALLINQVSDTKFDHSPMNALVFKYGESAKKNSVNLVQEVKTISITSTVYDKALADRIAATTPVVIPPATNTCAGGFSGNYAGGIDCVAQITSAGLSTGWLNLTSVGTDIYLHSNASLKNVDGLKNLITVPGMLTLSNNPMLTNIDGLSNLKTVNALTISGTSITDVSPLSNLTNVVYVNFDNKIYTTKLPAESYICQNWPDKIHFNGVGYANVSTRSYVCNP